MSSLPYCKTTAALTAILGLGLLAGPASASSLRDGFFSYSPGKWVVLKGSAAKNESDFKLDSDPQGISPSITVMSKSDSGVLTLKGSCSFTIVWHPQAGEKAPHTVSVTFHRQGTLIAKGSGKAVIRAEKKTLLEMDSSNDFLSGATTNISDIVLVVPMTKQKDGTYAGTGRFTSDIVSATYNKQGSPITSCQEIFSLADIASRD